MEYLNYTYPHIQNGGSRFYLNFLLAPEGDDRIRSPCANRSRKKPAWLLQMCASWVPPKNNLIKMNFPRHVSNPPIYTKKLTSLPPSVACPVLSIYFNTNHHSIAHRTYRLALSSTSSHHSPEESVTRFVIASHPRPLADATRRLRAGVSRRKGLLRLRLG